MRIAVTGADGFIGRHVVNELIKKDIEVIAICRKKVDFPSTLNRRAFQQHILDIRNVSKHTYDDLGRPEQLVHLAWGGLNDFQSPRHIDLELPMHDKFLSNMIESGLPQLLVTGTCLEYGIQSGELHESSPSIPTTSYGKAKKLLWERLNSLATNRKLNVTWARIFYMYGEGQPKNCLFSQINNAVNNGCQTFKMSKGDQIRDYLPVNEVSSSIVNLALKKSNVGIINICSGKPISIYDLVQQWKKHYSWEINLELGYYPYPSYEAMSFWGNRDKLDYLLTNNK